VYKGRVPAGGKCNCEHGWHAAGMPAARNRAPAHDRLLPSRQAPTRPWNRARTERLARVRWPQCRQVQSTSRSGRQEPGAAPSCVFNLWITWKSHWKPFLSMPFHSCPSASGCTAVAGRACCSRPPRQQPAPLAGATTGCGDGGCGGHLRAV